MRQKTNWPTVSARRSRDKVPGVVMPAKIKDEFTKLPVSRQRKKQLRWLRDGLCKLCGRTRNENSAQFCPFHHLCWNRYHSGYMQARLRLLYAENHV